MIGGSSAVGHDRGRYRASRAEHGEVTGIGTMTIMGTPMPDPAKRADVEIHALQAQLWARAHHEAAHAVAGTLLGGRVISVELWSGPPVAGRVRVTGLDDSTDGPGDHGLVRRIVYLLAGPIAERIAGGESGSILNEAASIAATALMMGIREPARIDQSTDLGAVAALLVDYFGPTGEAPASAAADHLPLSVEGLVRDHWSAIQLVVASLLRHGRLTEEQFQSIITVALPAPTVPDLLHELPARSDPPA